MIDHNKFKKELFSNQPFALAVTAINNEYVKEDFLKEEGSLERYNTCRKCIIDSIYNGEIINLDSSLDDLIHDTEVPESEINVPYDSFFINKWFIHKNFAISGASFRKIEEYGLVIVLPMFKIAENNFGTFDCVIELVKSGKFITNLKDVDVMDADFTEMDKSVQKDANELVHDVIKYVANSLFIITMKNKDIKHVKINPSNKKTKTMYGDYDPQFRPVTHIRISGEIKNYVNEYKKAKKSKKFKKSMIVSGHWRVYRDERYTKMKGQMQWIAPYVKGSGKEIIHRFVIINK